jgi:preprotein translocase subunit SecE
MNIFTRFVNYIKESRDELQKVAWPTRKETIRNTILVIAISLFVAVFLGAIDLGLTYVLKIVI